MHYPRILITGSDGLIGQAIQRKLANWPEADVLATGLELSPRFKAGAGGYVALDVTDQKAVERIFLDFSPTAVIHLAAMSKVEECETYKEACWRTNVDATAQIARLCKYHGAHLVFLSTDFVFDGQDGPYAEDDHPAPINAYGRSKQAAENAILLSGLNRWASVRTTLAFGTGDDLKRLNIATMMARELRAGKSFSAASDQFRTPTYALDLADGVRRIVQFGKEGVYHVSGRERLSVFEFCRQAASVFGFDPEMILPTLTTDLHPSAPRPLNAGLLILRAETELGFRPRLLADAFVDLGKRLGLPVEA